MQGAGASQATGRTAFYSQARGTLWKLLRRCCPSGSRLLCDLEPVNVPLCAPASWWCREGQMR